MAGLRAVCASQRERSWFLCPSRREWDRCAHEDFWCTVTVLLPLLSQACFRAVCRWTRRATRLTLIRRLEAIEEEALPLVAMVEGHAVAQRLERHGGLMSAALR